MDHRIQCYMDRIDQITIQIKIVQDQSRQKISNLYREVWQIKAHLDDIMKKMASNDWKTQKEDSDTYNINQIQSRYDEENSIKMQNQSEIQNINSYILGDLETAAKKWVDPNCTSFKCIKLIRQKIVAKKPADVFSCVRLSERCYFSIKIQHFMQDIGIGIADASLKERKFISGGVNYTYYTALGFSWIGSSQKKIGKGYKLKQTIIVQVDMINCTVEWRVKDEIRNRVNFAELKNKSIQWVPIIGLGNQNDILTLVP